MIRQARPSDMEALIRLGMAMHEESRYRVLDFSVAKTSKTLAHAINSDDWLSIVYEHSGNVIGGFFGFVCPHLCSNDLVAADFVLFVDPDKRGGIAAARMVKDYVRWATSKGAKIIDIGISTGVRVEETGQLYESLGAKAFGRLYQFRG